MISLILAVALCGAAYLLLARRDPPPPAGPLLAFQPSQVVALIVERPAPGAGTEGAYRLGDGSEWEIRWSPGDGGDPRSWPASPTPVRAALRILSTLAAAAEADAGVKPDAAAARVSLLLDDKTERVLRLGSQPMAGRVLVEVIDPPPGPARPARGAGRVCWVDSGISDALVGTGLRAWRDRTAFPNIGVDVSRITLRGAGGTLALARVAGKWALREPVSAPADEQAVRTLLAGLASIQIADFGDAGLRAPAQAAPPLAALVLESDVREPVGDVFVTRTTIRDAEFASIAGLASDQVLVRLRRRTESRQIDGSGGGGAPETAGYAFTVPLADVSGLAATPESYLSRIAAASAPGDVGQLVIRRADASRTFVRTIDGWAEARDGETPLPLAPEDRIGLEALLKLLCETRAEGVSLAQPGGWSGARTIELRSLGGQPLGSVEAGVVSADGGEVLALYTQPVWRTYSSPAATGTLRWLNQTAP